MKLIFILLLCCSSTFAGELHYLPGDVGMRVSFTSQDIDAIVKSGSVEKSFYKHVQMACGTYGYSVVEVSGFSKRQIQAIREGLKSITKEEGRGYCFYLYFESIKKEDEIKVKIIKVDEKEIKIKYPSRKVSRLIFASEIVFSSNKNQQNIYKEPKKEGGWKILDSLIPTRSKTNQKYEKLFIKYKYHSATNKEIIEFSRFMMSLQLNGFSPNEFKDNLMGALYGLYQKEKSEDYLKEIKSTHALLNFEKDDPLKKLSVLEYAKKKYQRIKKKRKP